MTSGIAIERIKQRLQKQDTNTNSNILDEEYEDALEKGLNDWLRRQHHGFNQFKEGDEQSVFDQLPNWIHMNLEVHKGFSQVFLNSKKK